MSRQFNSAELIDKCNFSWDELCSQEADRQAFLRRLGSLANTEPSVAEIVSTTDEGIGYASESYIPADIDDTKQNLIFMLGNPAPESVASRAMYAYENHGRRYHRFWRVLDDTGILRFRQNPDTLDPFAKMTKLYTHEYDSPFNIFVVPFYSFPTPPAGEWNGVAGLRRLFGSAFTTVAASDYRSIEKLFETYLRDGDSILVFQKDAYLALSETQQAPQPYNYRSLLQEPIVSDFLTQSEAHARLFCMLPTRLLHSHQTKATLASLATEL